MTEKTLLIHHEITGVSLRAAHAAHRCGRLLHITQTGTPNAQALSFYPVDAKMDNLDKFLDNGTIQAERMFYFCNAEGDLKAEIISREETVMLELCKRHGIPVTIILVPSVEPASRGFGPVIYCIQEALQRRLIGDVISSLKRLARDTSPALAVRPDSDAEVGKKPYEVTLRKIANASLQLAGAPRMMPNVQVTSEGHIRLC